MTARRGNYSNIIVYDERRRYYYMWPQKNKPFLDDEIRDMGVGLLDQVRRSVQTTFGDVAVPYVEYSGAHSTVNAFKVKQSVDSDRNFKVVGGSSLDHPAVLFAKGFYIFLTGDLEYKFQQYSSDLVDIQTQADKSLTLTPIPMLTTPSTNRIDIVYVHLHFEEVTAANGTDSEVYKDTGLKNPVVGTETANRLRAVIDIRVREGWTGTINKDIFDHNEFLGGISSGDVDPTDNDYKIPIAAIYRDAFQNTISDSHIVDLLSLYNKRVFSLGELSYRVRNGGYTETGVYEKGLSGFSPQFAGVKYDEGAFATGLNRGLGTEAFNTNSVTPRILDNNGKFFMRGLMVGHDTGIVKYETGPEALGTGEAIVQNLSARSIYAGYGVTGITGMREYKNSLDVVIKGETGKGGLSVLNLDGVTGSKTAYIKATHGGVQENFFVVDYRGRIGLNTFTPGWDKPLAWENTDRYHDGLYGVTGVNIVQDVNGSIRLRDHVFADKDVYVNRDIFGQTWKIPAALSDKMPAMFGFTGIPSGGYTGIQDSISALIFKRGIAVVGDTGVSAYGYTGMGVAGQYECFDAQGQRMFTIGDLGNDFDRVIKSLYGVASRRSLTSSCSLLDINNGTFSPDGTVIVPATVSLGELQAGDVVDYDIVLENGDHVTGVVNIVSSGIAGVIQVKNHILANPGFLQVGNPLRTDPYSRIGFDYYDVSEGVTYFYPGAGNAFGVQVIEDPFGAAAHAGDPTIPLQDGKIILKDMPEDPVKVELDQVAHFTVNRALNPSVDISFVPGAYYGAVEYGGTLSNIKFAKLDLGEGADGWLFNGDVYFNGNGFMNRVTFSPNVIFRNDVFVYGTLFADQQFFNFANVLNLLVRNNMTVLKRAEIILGLGLGDGSLAALTDFQADEIRYPDLLLYANGKIMSKSIEILDYGTVNTTLGSLYQTSTGDAGKVYAQIGGTIDGTSTPYGIHLVDDRAIDSDKKFKEVVVDAQDSFGNFNDVLLRVKGALVTDNYFISNFLGVGDIQTIDTDYKFQVSGNAIISDTLTVKELKFSGTSAPEGSPDIVTPVNISVISSNVSPAADPTGNHEAFDNNATILRDKKFTSYKRIDLNNDNWLGSRLSGESGTNYYNYFIVADDAVKARWARDNVSYTETQFEGVVSASPTDDSIVVNNVPAAYRRYSCERIKLCSLGTITAVWNGFISDPGAGTRGLEITKYEFSSPYFRSSSGTSTINWLPGTSRSGDDNFIAHVEGSFVDAGTGIPNIYTIEKTLGIYVPLSTWWYAKFDEDALHTGFKSVVLYQPYENIVSGIDPGPTNNLIFPVTVQSTGAVDSNWRVALYPRLVSQSRSPGAVNYEQLYTGTWDLDLVLLPEKVGTSANLIGRAYISFVQG